jgi:DUF2934 family protein
MPFMPTKQSADEFNLTDFVNLTDRVVATQQQLVLSYLTSGIRIAEALRSPRKASRHEESDNGTREVPAEASAESDEVDVSDDSIRARAYELYEQRDRRPGGALDDWNRARAELQAVAPH